MLDLSFSKEILFIIRIISNVGKINDGWPCQGNLLHSKHD